MIAHAYPQRTQPRKPFLEEKNSSNRLTPPSQERSASANESLLLLFFRKEGLASLRIARGLGGRRLRPVGVRGPRREVPWDYGRAALSEDHGSTFGRTDQRGPHSRRIEDGPLAGVQQA